MKSVATHLLALTLLTCLAVAVFVERQAISAATSDLAKLRAATETVPEEDREKQRQFELLTRTINRRATDFELLSRTVDRAADSLNHAALSIVGPAAPKGAVSGEIIPTFSRQGEYRERTKLHVPANRDCELQLKFMDGDGNPEFFEDFEAPSRLSIPLASGENLIEVHFDWNGVPNTFTLTNHTSAIAVCSRARDARGNGWSPALGQGFYRLLSLPRQFGMTIFDGGLGFKKDTRIVVQMVESKKQ
jgi:hypothetical protein